FIERNPVFKKIIRDENLYLTFDDPKPEQSGTYRCRGLLQNSESLENQINVTIYEDVTWDHCPETQYLIKGNVGERINCRASANPKPNIIWTKGNRQLDSNPRYLINSSGLIIKDAITDDDGGLFRISALVTETGATHEKRITVQIYDRPNIETISEPKFGIENEQIELRCEASGRPKPLYTWLDTNRRNLSSVSGYAVDRAIGNPTPKMTIRRNGLTRAFNAGDQGVLLEEKMEFDEKVLTLIYLNTVVNEFDLIVNTLI
ncbi:fasciclin-2-like protein, partial [Sarcoptes scabiei]